MHDDNQDDVKDWELILKYLSHINDHEDYLIDRLDLKDLFDIDGESIFDSISAKELGIDIIDYIKRNT